MVVPSVAAHRKFVGTTCLYRHLALRQPPFLQRNLDRALIWHQDLLAERSRRFAVAVAVVDEPGEEMIANEKREAGWDYPTPEMMAELMKGQKPILRLDALQIRHVDAVGVNGGDRPHLQEIKTEPDWLPDPNIDFSAPCLVTLMFIDSGKELNRQERIHVDTRSGTIESSIATTKERIFDIALENPFSIEVEKINVTIERGSSGTKRWKRTIPAHYQLNVEIKCLNHKDAAHLLGLMEKKSAFKYRSSLTEEDASLRVTWYDLPECPPAGKLLAMTRTDGPDHTTNMNFGVEVSMGWRRNKDSPLAVYAKSRRSALVPDQIQLPTPSASDESDNTTRRTIVTYIFMDERMDERIHKMPDFRCPLCATAPSARAQHVFPTFDRLHTHILLWHDHFQPRIVTQSNPQVYDSEYTIQLSLSNTLTEKTTQPTFDGDEDEWIAPEQPFDLQKYLDGTDTWTRHVKQAERPQHNAAKKQSSTGPGTIKPRPTLSEINDIPDVPKAKWPLPTVPRVRFYRTKSKRPFEADEEISESDESVDESWLQAHKRDDMSSLPISAGGKEFYQDWNLAAAEDDFPADLFIRECLVRFSKKFGGKMRDGEYYAEFAKTVDRLHSLKLIDDEVRSYCTDRRRLVSSAPDLPVKRRRLHAADHQLNRRDNTASKSHSAQGGKVCSCGLPITSARAAITCHNIRCSRVQYHMACVGLARRPDNWQCPECCAAGGGGGGGGA